MIPILQFGKRLLLAALLPLLLSTSCVKEDVPVVTGDTLVEVTIKAPAPAATRGLDTAQENDVQYIDILAFDPVSGAFEYSVRTGGAAITTPNTGSPGVKTFTVILREGTWDLVFLANLRDEVSATSLHGTTKSAALAALTVSLPSGGWPADGSAPCRCGARLRPSQSRRALPSAPGGTPCR